MYSSVYVIAYINMHIHLLFQYAAVLKRFEMRYIDNKAKSDSV